MEFTQTYQASNPGIFNELFQTAQIVDRIEVDFYGSKIYDVTIFFKDSEEPFPLTSLREDSTLRKSIEEKIN